MKRVRDVFASFFSPRCLEVERHLKCPIKKGIQIPKRIRKLRRSTYNSYSYWGWYINPLRGIPTRRFWCDRLYDRRYDRWCGCRVIRNHRRSYESATSGYGSWSGRRATESAATVHRPSVVARRRATARIKHV